MPIYKVEGPGGRIYKVEGPEGASEAEVIAFLQESQGAVAEPRVTSRKRSVAEMNYRNAMEEANPANVPASENFAAAMGRSVYETGRGIGQLAGLVSDEDIEASRRMDAPLTNTEAGKWGGMAGFASQMIGPGSAASVIKGGAQLANLPRAAQAAGAMQRGFLPITAKGAAVQGAALGALQPATSGSERFANAAMGAGGGYVGAKAGNAIAGLARADAPSVPSQRAQAIAEARAAGYVLPPSEMGRGGLTGALEGLSGKQQIGQHASAKNQKVTNTLARKALGLPDDAPLTLDTLDALRAEAGKAYADVAALGALPVTGKLPANVSVSTSQNALLAGKQRAVDAGELVRAWKQANHDATAYYRAYARDANPETLAKAKSAAAEAKQIDGFLLSSLDSLGRKDMAQALKAARVRIAKTYTVENALNGVTGDVSAQALAAALKKGKPLSSELKAAAKAGQAFPKATQALKDPPRMFSPWDLAAGGVGVGSVNVPLMAAVAGRPAVRASFLSKPMQDLFARQATQGRSIPRMIQDPRIAEWLEQARRASQAGAIGYGVD